MGDLRLGDIIDDYCVKCRRVTNHAVVSLLDGKAAKVRCRTCYSDHDFRNEQAPPSKKDLKKAALFAEVLMNSGAPAAVPEVAGEVTPAPTAEVPEAVSAPAPAPAPAPAKKSSKKKS
jgi:hypothetical protein